MTPENFVYWLQGYFELAEPTAGLSAVQTQAIKNHLALVFIHSIDPAATGNLTAEEAQATQKVLNDVHNNIHYSPPGPRDPDVRYRY